MTQIRQIIGSAATIVLALAPVPRKRSFRFGDHRRHQRGSIPDVDR